VAVALAASPAAFDQAYRSLRRGGRLVCVALPADNATLSLPIFDTVINGKTVIGSIVGTRNDLADVFALHAAGRTTVIAVDRKIDEVNQSIDDVLAGTVPARVVFQFCGCLFRRCAVRALPTRVGLMAARVPVRRQAPYRTRRRAGTSRPPHPASRNDVTASVKGWEPPGVYSEHLLVISSKPELCA
jgi:hypothetical protein